MSLTVADFQFSDADRAACHVVADASDRVRALNAIAECLDRALAIPDVCQIVLAFYKLPYVGRAVPFDVRCATDDPDGSTGGTKVTRDETPSDGGLWTNQNLTVDLGMSHIKFCWTDYNQLKSDTAAATANATATDSKSTATAAAAPPPPPASLVTPQRPVCVSTFFVENVVARSKYISLDAYTAKSVSARRPEINNSNTAYSGMYRQMHPLDGESQGINNEPMRDMLYYGTGRVGTRSSEPSTQPLILASRSCPPFTRVEREQLIACAFDDCKAPAAALVSSEMCVCFSSGWTTGLVVDCGASATRVVPVYEGGVLNDAMRYSRDFCGSVVDAWLARLLMNECGVSFSTSNERRQVTAIKERYCYVARDFAKAGAYHKSVDAPAIRDGTFRGATYESQENGRVPLPTLVQCGAPEVYFQPSLAGGEGNSLPQMIYDVIMKCPVELRAALWDNIVLAGGSSLFDGFAERLYFELLRLVSPTTCVRIVAAPFRHYAVAVGASILSEFDRDEFTIQRSEYETSGVDVVHRRCVPGL